MAAGRRDCGLPGPLRPFARPVRPGPAQSAGSALWDAIFSAAGAYAVQHLAYTTHTLIASYPIKAVPPALLGLLVKTAVYVLCCFLFAKRISSRGQFGTLPKGAFAVRSTINKHRAEENT